MTFARVRTAASPVVTEKPGPLLTLYEPAVSYNTSQMANASAAPSNLPGMVDVLAPGPNVR